MEHRLPWSVSSLGASDGLLFSSDSLSQVSQTQSYAPRGYQIAIYRKALEENLIVYLGTGCGKTLIAVLLIREIACRCRQKNEKFCAVFLAPTVMLVQQQTEVLSFNTDLEVENFYGAKGVDNWSLSDWRREVAEKEVLVMTPDVLHSAFSHGYLKMGDFKLIVFDECHRAEKRHSYARIMREYYDKFDTRKPRILGMTATPLVKKGVTSCEDSAKQIHLLESVLDAKLYTLEDKRELELHVATPVERREYYEPPKRSFDSVLQDLERLRDKYEEGFKHQMENSSYKDVQEKANKLSKKVKKLHADLEFSLRNLGLLCACESAKCLLKRSENGLMYDGEEFSSEAQDFLKAAASVLDKAIQMEKSEPNVCSESIAAIENGLLTPNVVLLVECLLRYKSKQDVRCIVFVTRVVTAMALAEVLSKIGCLSFLKCGYLTGASVALNAMGKRQRQCALEEFRRGCVNVLVATDVAEEGIDIPSCCVVIRFNPPSTVRSMIQSRGRARMKSSEFLIFLEKGNQKQLDHLESLIRSEALLKDETLSRQKLSLMVSEEPVEAVELFQVESTGAKITVHSSIKLIYHYCSKLPKDAFYVPKPKFIIDMVDHGKGSAYVCQLMMPANAPFRELKGPPRSSKSDAKQSVCLEACKLLYSMRQLTDHLVPMLNELEDITPRKNKKGAGTTKRKELHATTATEAFAGDWINESKDVKLHVYLLCFTSLEEDDQYVELALLFNAAIDDDILKVEIPLYLTKNRTVVAKIYAAGNYTLNSDQLKQAKAYQQLIFNGMFGKLVRHEKGKSKLKNWILSQSRLDETWSQSHMYLLLPLMPGKHAGESDSIPVDWEAVRNCAIAAGILSDIFSNVGSDQSHMKFVDSVETGHCGSESTRDIVHMACKTRSYDAASGMAVITIHTGRIYSVMEVLEDKNADCPMENLQCTEKSNYSSYKHYFAEKYNVDLKYPEQPLFQVKQTHRLHNLLRDGSDDPKKTKKPKETQRNALVEMPPELCLWIGIPNAVVKSMYLFPSVFHRFNSLISAGQLRTTIAKEMPDCKFIGPADVLKALTTERCLEGFSHEGLELLGDSFLKFAVSKYLYLVYGKHHEGQLSARRSKSICNEFLHNLAVQKGLSGYIRDEPFLPDCWSAPGMSCIKSVPCTCNLEDLTSCENGDWKGQGKTEGMFAIGKACSRGHRWICSKTISDTVEALIGAFLVSGGVIPAMKFMKWIGIEVDPDISLYGEAKNRCLLENVINGMNFKKIESCLGYEFSNKSLLVEALTHASYHDQHEEGYCYQRLEFLGDAVLDYLITRHLFMTHPGLSPGILSDLRAAAVNNECFSRVSVKYSLQRYFRHASSELLTQITTFVKDVTGRDHLFGWDDVHGPKVLGDIFESITGAMSVDSGFDLDRVWRVVKPMLSPLVTPSTLPLHPIRELCELSHSRRISLDWKMQRNKSQTLASVKIELGNETFTETGRGKDKKIAKTHAAQQALSFLASKGYVHPRRSQHGVEPLMTDKSNQKCEIVTQKCEEHAFECLPDGNADAASGSKRKCSISSETPVLGNRTLQCEDNNSSDEKRRKLYDYARTIRFNFDDIPQVDAIPSNSRQENGGRDCIRREAQSIRCSENKGSVDMRISTHVGVEQMKSMPLSIAKSGKEQNSRSDDERTASVMGSSVAMEIDTHNEVELIESTPMLITEGKSIAANSSMPCSTSGQSGNEQNSRSADERTASMNCMTISESILMALVELKKMMSLRMSQKGYGRALLNELCLKHKWGGPNYKEETGQGGALYTFTASIDGPLRDIKGTGDPRPRKIDAKESAAQKLLMMLTKLCQPD